MNQSAAALSLQRTLDEVRCPLAAQVRLLPPADPPPPAAPDARLYSATSPAQQIAVSVHPPPENVYIDQLIGDWLHASLHTLPSVHPDALARRAAETLLTRSLAPGVDAEQAGDLCALFTELSLLPYEDMETIGRLALDSEGALPLVLALRRGTPLEDIRAVRKHLEVASSGLCLVSDGVVVRGWCSATAAAESPQIAFAPHGFWSFSTGERTHFDVRFGRPFYPARQRVQAQLSTALRSTFVGIADQDVARLARLVAAAARQQRGTNLLITDAAAREAQRLRHQCTLVEPCPLDEALIAGVTAIDGTVILNTRGECFGIGAILDGGASRGGSPARGGRYNSAVMYCESAPEPCVIVVISQDGSVDFCSSNGELTSRRQDSHP